MNTLLLQPSNLSYASSTCAGECQYDYHLTSLVTQLRQGIFQGHLQALQEGQGIVIDLDFEEQMTESEVKSLCGQLQYAYSSNTRAAVPCHLYFTSLQASISIPPLLTHIKVSGQLGIQGAV